MRCKQRPETALSTRMWSSDPLASPQEHSRASLLEGESQGAQSSVTLVTLAETNLDHLTVRQPLDVWLNWNKIGELPGQTPAELKRVKSKCLLSYDKWGLPKWHSGKESACQCQRGKRLEFSPWVWKIPCRRKWQPIPVFLPGKFHGQRSLEGYSPWGCKELDMTEWLSTHTYNNEVVISYSLKTYWYVDPGNFISVLAFKC